MFLRARKFLNIYIYIFLVLGIFILFVPSLAFLRGLWSDDDNDPPSPPSPPPTPHPPNFFCDFWYFFGIGAHPISGRTLRRLPPL